MANLPRESRPVHSDPDAWPDDIIALGPPDPDLPEHYWPGWTEEAANDLGDFFLDLEDRPEWMSFPDWVDSIANRLRDLGSSGARWLADEIAAVADEARSLGACSPEQFADRRSAEIDGHRLAALDDAYERGRRDALGPGPDGLW